MAMEGPNFHGLALMAKEPSVPLLLRFHACISAAKVLSTQKGNREALRRYD